MTFKKIAVGVLAAAAVAVTAPATAHADPVRNFFLCDSGLNCENYTSGTITWHNRTATVSGHVVDKGAGFTIAKFQGYAGTTPVGPQESRYVDDASANPNLTSPRKIGFGLGDTNKPGGINRILIELCFTESSCQYSAVYTKP